jgi:hypothetical protein
MKKPAPENGTDPRTALRGQSPFPGTGVIIGEADGTRTRNFQIDNAGPERAKDASAAKATTYGKRGSTRFRGNEPVFNANPVVYPP